MLVRKNEESDGASEGEQQSAADSPTVSSDERCDEGDDGEDKHGPVQPGGNSAKRAKKRDLREDCLRRPQRPGGGNECQCARRDSAAQE